MSSIIEIVGAWALVAALAASAHGFGRFSQTGPRRRSADRRRRVGVALSIAGPLAVVPVGLAVAAVTGRWVAAALGSALAIIATSLVGLALAPD